MLERVVDIAQVLIDGLNVTPDKAIEIAAQIAQTEHYMEQDRIRTKQYDSAEAVIGTGVNDAL